ncbi:hypothetical protein [Methylobacterium oxalidis]|uniref:Uncharacterized protein n=1 Tax=Methylobacterium oxalidis TaxID=944322 RepID=A0A512JBN8_9HYPH|nr:hypothetical protein [Methylobacterium oxalidis]GEP07393.1 hypothetical protein MOX02_54310 [Methylobacterium oxalidis]GJE35343.1 hypothetical protein LDDCCGHA_5561 [Methylobacterium oxalidis]GLS67662.1 hypothetical protein GCM10007888_60470 [Methylobacterium oxalidis]
MSRAHTLKIEHIPFHADPILAAIDAHSEAWAVFQVAPEAAVSQRHAELCAATARLLATPCATRFGELALLRHLRWHLEHDEVLDTAMQAQAADLAASLNLDFPPCSPPRRPLAPLLRLLARAGEIAACLALIAGGAVLTGFATLL